MAEQSGTLVSEGRIDRHITVQLEHKFKSSTVNMSETSAATGITVGELAVRSGVPASALRFYERQGLIHSRRTAGNQRRYARDTLRRIAFIKASQRVGIPLSMILEVLALLPEGRTPTEEDWRRVSDCWRADLDARMKLLAQLRDELLDCIGCGCLSLERCALANPGDALGREGPGARRLPLRGPQEQAATTSRTEDNM